eukprot:scaffold54147_cov21-Tisochrysis_lutea.AAC.2
MMYVWLEWPGKKSRPVTCIKVALQKHMRGCKAALKCTLYWPRHVMRGDILAWPAAAVRLLSLQCSLHMHGKVRVDGRVVEKAGTAVPLSAKVEIDAEEPK